MVSIKIKNNDWKCQGRRKLGWMNSKRPMRKQMSNLTSSFHHGQCLSAYPKEKCKTCLIIFRFLLYPPLSSNMGRREILSFFHRVSWENQRTTFGGFSCKPCEGFPELNSHYIPLLSPSNPIWSILIPLNYHLEPTVGMVYMVHDVRFISIYSF